MVWTVQYKYDDERRNHILVSVIHSCVYFLHIPIPMCNPRLSAIHLEYRTIITPAVGIMCLKATKDTAKIENLVCAVPLPTPCTVLCTYRYWRNKNFQMSAADIEAISVSGVLSPAPPWIREELYCTTAIPS